MLRKAMVLGLVASAGVALGGDDMGKRPRTEDGGQPVGDRLQYHNQSDASDVALTRSNTNDEPSVSTRVDAGDRRDIREDG